MFCPECGSELKEGTKFCGACGARMTEVQDAPARKSGWKRTAAIALGTVAVVGGVVAGAIALLGGPGPAPEAGGQQVQENETTAAGETVGEENTGDEISGICLPKEVRVSYSGSGFIGEYIRYSYDDRGNVTAVTTWEGSFSPQTIDTFAEDETVLAQVLDADAHDKESYVYAYDENGGKIAESYRTTDMGDGDYDNYDYTFDANGNLLEEIHSDNEGNTSQNYRYTYNENGDMIQKDYYLRDGSLSISIVNTYDANHNALTSQTVNADGEVENNRENTYDANGNRLSVVVYDDGVPSEAEEYTYDADGKQQTRTRYNCVDGERYQVLFDEYSYDGAGNCVTRVIYDNDGAVSQDWVWTYDENGNMLTEVHNASGLNEKTSTYTYDDAGRMLSEIYTGYADAAHSSYSYTYDSEGCMATKTLYDRDGNEKETTEYTYDKAGNPVTEVCLNADGSEYSRTEYTYITVENKD